MNKKFSRLSIPYLVWLILFAVLPAMVMVLLMFVKAEGIDFKEMRFTLENFQQLGEVSTRKAFLNSLSLAAFSTVFCIFFGYLVAYKLFRSHFRNKYLMLIILILPMWSNLLLRTEALASFMERENVISDIIKKIFGKDEIQWLDLRGTTPAVMIGLIVTYVPFMVMPIYNALEKIDPSIEEAALDLGLTDMKKFWRVIFPMSSKGIITGSIMVFLPCLSGFAIPKILGNDKVVMIGNIIESLFNNVDYNTGSMLAVVILAIILISISIVNKVDKEGDTLL